MFDNLRRSLVAPMSLALLLLALAGHGLSPWAALGLVLAAFAAGPLIGAVAGFSPRRDDIAKLPLLPPGRPPTWRARCAARCGSWRNCCSRRCGRWMRSCARCTAWPSAAATCCNGPRPRRPRPPRAATWPRCCAGIAPSRCVPRCCWRRCGSWARRTRHWRWGCACCGLPRRCGPGGSAGRVAAAGADALPLHEQAYLHGVARDTWRFFERCVGAEDHHLPPDNLQTSPHDMLAHRTSPTNIGLYLLSVACARQFGWIGTQELLARLEATLATLHTLQRHRGHFLNWYDTQTLRAAAADVRVHGGQRQPLRPPAGAWRRPAWSWPTRLSTTRRRSAHRGIDAAAGKPLLAARARLPPRSATNPALVPGGPSRHPALGRARPAGADRCSGIGHAAQRLRALAQACRLLRDAGRLRLSVPAPSVTCSTSASASPSSSSIPASTTCWRRSRG